MQARWLSLGRATVSALSFRVFPLWLARRITWSSLLTLSKAANQRTHSSSDAGRDRTHTAQKLKGGGGGVAQRVQRPTETPGVILTRLRVPGAARDFFPTVRTLLGCPYSPLCAVACISCAHVRNSKHWQPYSFLGHTKILHTLIGMGSAALAADVPYPGKEIRISRKGQSVLKKKKNCWLEILQLGSNF